MTTHIVHSPTDVARGVVLYDDCRRCDEHSFHPAESLDDGNLRLLLSRPPKTVPEIRAYSVLREVVQIYRRLDALGVADKL